MSTPKSDIRRSVVRIAGAGPAGLAAAIFLARNGFKAEVHEARDKVGSRWKRGHQIIENFSQKEDLPDFLRRHGIRMDFGHDPIRSCQIFAAGRSGRSFAGKEALGYFVRRGSSPGDLDHALCEQAKEAGVKVVFGSALTPAQADIVATGPSRTDGMGKERTFPFSGSQRLCVILDPKLAPGGYAYLFVSDGQGTLGAAVLSDYRRLDEILEGARARFESLLGLAIPPKGDEAYLKANFFLKPRLSAEGTLWAGEAAGFQDYLFGFGIRYALRSGLLAARSRVEDGDYEALWKKEIAPSQEIALMNRYGYERLGPFLPGVFLAGAGAAGDFRNYMRAWYYPDPLRRILAVPVSRIWKRGRLWVDPAAGVRVKP